MSGIADDIEIRAFPSGPDDAGSFNLGMELRDYFAAKAMQAFCAQWKFDVPLGGAAKVVMSQNAYALADAMLRERKK